MPIITDIYGNVSNDIESPVVTDVSAASQIDDVKWSELLTKVNAERTRRGNAGIADPGFTGEIQASDLNALKDALTAPPALGTVGFLDKYGVQTRATYLDASAVETAFTPAGAYTSGFQGVLGGETVTAAHINSMIDKLQGAASICTCNCNYCTCNCNYCTCNCNYACTCNCNYSDILVKTNIRFIGRKNGLKMYTWTYIGDKFNVVYKGIIAQQLIGTKYQKALSKDAYGVYMVDYSKLPVNFERI